MPLDTILCLDTSGSMAGRGMRELKAAVTAFLDGVMQTAQQTGLQENVAVVEFGRSTRIIHPLSTDYALMKRKVASLQAGSTTPMFEGLMEAMKEIIAHGGVVSLRGTNIRLTPRVIMMTDGRPDNKEKVLATAVAFSPKGWSEVGLPHPIPIACVGMGTDVDQELLAAIAVITNGMFTIGDASELSTFFRRQVLLIRFLIQFQSDMNALRDMLILRAFLEELGERVRDEEAEALMKLLLAMIILAADDDDDDDDDGPSALPASSRPQLRALPPPTVDDDGVETITVQMPPDRASSYSTNSDTGCCCTIL